MKKPVYGQAYKFRMGENWYGNWIKLTYDPRDEINEGYEDALEWSSRDLLFVHLGRVLEKLVKPSDITTIQDLQTFRGLEEDIEQFLKPEVAFTKQD